MLGAGHQLSACNHLVTTARMAYLAPAPKEEASGEGAAAAEEGAHNHRDDHEYAHCGMDAAIAALFALVLAALAARVCANRRRDKMRRSGLGLGLRGRAHS